MTRVLSVRGWQYPLVLSIAVLAFFSPLMFRQTHFKAGVVTSDFPASIEFAQHIQQGMGDVPGYILAHSAWDWLLIAGNSILGISFRMSAFLVSIASILAAAWILYLFWFAPVLRARGISPWWGVAAAFVLNLVTPVSLLSSLDRKWYLGYIGITSYHNPTIILLQPLALLQFALALRCFQQAGSRGRDIAFAGAVTLLATFAKPSFAICFLPAFCLLAAYRWWKKQVVDWRLLALGFAVPTVFLLGVQYLLAYGSPEQAGILFDPFLVMSGLSGFLGIKLLLSIAFPLVMTLLFFEDMLHDTRMALAWLTFLLAAFFAYFLAEGAPRTLDGNFVWGAKTSLLVLFAACTVLLFEKMRPVRWQAVVAGAILAVHAAWGLLYYHHVFVTQKYI